LFIHGACLGAWCWTDHFLEFFALAGYHAVALNLRGHGGSSGRKSLSKLGIDDFVQDVASIAFGMPKAPVVIGHSMGGLIAQRFAARHASSGVVLLAPSPVKGMRPHGMALIRAHPWPFFLAILTRDMLKIYPDNRRVRHIMFSPDTPEETVSRCRERLQKESWRACQEMNEPLGVPYPIASRMLVLGGEHDATVPPRAVLETAGAYQAPCHIFPGVGHNLMLEPNWREVAGYIEAWLHHGQST
jgi:pimeloyl-ACP methyl ester carboxylesterase